jgi:hypothetical protein
VHDRRIEGETIVFGNYGALWMNAMTWYDHATESIWSQPWGRALTGPLKGTQLQLLPFSLVPWSTWAEEHPNTLALIPDGRGGSRQRPSDNFVLGVAIGELARAYRYEDALGVIIINDMMGQFPLLVHVNPETRSIHIFIRQIADGTELVFSGDAEMLVDDVTGSIWDPERGLAIDGELRGQVIREIPYISSFDWAWHDFYPHSDFYND